ncbi:restriction endonuclease subunit S [Corynebacterium glyciniphilum]|nr:restriction endonuclease subunit S [Corynebacterium glyciniphilum]
MSAPLSAEVQLRRLATCRDDLREPLNAVERSERPGDVPYWGANSIQGYVDKAKLDFPVVLLGEDGAPFFDRSRDVSFYRNEPIWPNNHIHVLVPSEATDGRWLAYALNSVDYSRVINGSTRDKLTQSAMMSIALPNTLPDGQRAIADYLDRETQKIDELITEQRDLIETLRERRKSVIDQGAEESVAERIRLRYLFLPAEVRNQHGEQVLSVYRDYGVIPKGSRDGNYNVTPEDVSRYLLVRPGDLVVNRMKAWQGSLGISQHRGIVSGDYEVLRPTTERLHPMFAHLYLRSARMVGQYVVRSTGIRPSQWRLYWKQMGDIAIPVPPIRKQQEIVSFVSEQISRIDELISESQDLITLSKERRAALITAAVTGQIDVREAA